MSNTQNQEHLTGPWQAVVSNCGESYPDIRIAMVELGAEGSVDISVRRGTALPHQDDDGYLPGSYISGDMAYELEGVYFSDGDPSTDAEARWVQAQAMAAGLNAASEAASAPVHHTTVSPVDDRHLGPDFCSIWSCTCGARSDRPYATPMVKRQAQAHREQEAVASRG